MGVWQTGSNKEIGKQRIGGSVSLKILEGNAEKWPAAGGFLHKDMRSEGRKKKFPAKAIT